MITHKVKELTGIFLEGAVALAEGRILGDAWNEDDCIWVSELDGTFGDSCDFYPSEDWTIGGPIIERERIGVEYMKQGVWTAQPRNEAGYYVKEANGSIYPAVGRGPTPLIAAMRAFVASKFGDTVELPIGNVEGWCNAFAARYAGVTGCSMVDAREIARSAMYGEPDEDGNHVLFEPLSMHLDPIEMADERIATEKAKSGGGINP